MNKPLMYIVGFLGAVVIGGDAGNTDGVRFWDFAGFNRTRLAGVRWNARPDMLGGHIYEGEKVGRRKISPVRFPVSEPGVWY